MASRIAWTDDELAVLDRHVDEPDWLRTVASKIGGRTIQALKVRMAKRRAELGLGDGRGGSDDMDEFNAKAAAASEALLVAIERAGLRP